MPRKSGPIDDPVIAELLKRKVETAKDIDEKIKKRRLQLNKSERDKRDRVLVLTGVAYHADANLHPEMIPEIRATLDRGIVNPKDREFLKSMGWL